MKLYELPVYLPEGWEVRIYWDRVVLVAPDVAIARAFQQGAALSLKATTGRLGRPVEVSWLEVSASTRPKGCFGDVPPLA